MAKTRTFGTILRKIRESAGISQDMLAHEAGLDRTAIGRIERGEREPTLSSIFAIAKALKIRPSQIIAKMER